MADARLKLTSNFEKWVSRVPSKLRKQARYAGMQALNDAATQTRAETLKDMGYTFDRPTRWAMRGLYIQYAKRDNLIATVRVNSALTNKQGRAQMNTLRPHFEGGGRRLKAFETSLQRNNLMPTGWYAVAGSGAAAVGALDAYGNVRGPFITQLLSYFSAFREGGYRANMTAKRKANLAKRGKSGSGISQIGGVVYFIARKDAVYGAGAWRKGRVNHLAPGIWAKTGLHGTEVKPVILYVTHVQYHRRIDLPNNARQVMAGQFKNLFWTRYRAALASAR